MPSSYRMIDSIITPLCQICRQNVVVYHQTLALWHLIFFTAIQNLETQRDGCNGAICHLEDIKTGRFEFCLEDEAGIKFAYNSSRTRSENHGSKNRESPGRIQEWCLKGRHPQEGRSKDRKGQSDSALRPVSFFITPSPPHRAG